MGKIGAMLAELAQEKWERSRSLFDPEKCDADAFTAMVALGLRVESSESGQVYVWKGFDLIWNSFALHGDIVAERMAATRLAIDSSISQLREMELATEGGA